MNSGRESISRRTFLQLLAGTGIGMAASCQSTSSRPRTESELPPNPFHGRWTGDDFSVAHRFLFPGQEQEKASFLAETRKAKRESFDVVIVGGGVSGLVSLFHTDGLNAVLLEKEQTLGGNAKKQAWGTLEYSIGAAYCATPENGDAMDTLYKAIGVKEALRRPTEEADGVFFQRKFVKEFWQGLTDRARSKDFVAFKQFMEFLNGEKFPGIPFEKDSPYSQDEFQFLDRQSLGECLSRGIPADLRRLKDSGFPYSGSVIPVHPHIQEFVEYYCWSAFGASAFEISAYAGLNFIAPEFGGISVLPGGNASIVQALEQTVRAQGKQIRSGRLAIDIAKNSKGLYEVAVVEGGKTPELYETRSVILALPKFAARKLLHNLPDDQSQAMAKIDYRPYVVANLLLKRQPRLTGFDSYCLDGNFHWEADQEIQSLVDRCNASSFADIIPADWARAEKLPYSVLTLYRPYNSAAKRRDIYSFNHQASSDEARQKAKLDDETKFKAMQEEIRRKVIPLLNDCGLEESDILDINLSRWGHPMLACRPGQLSSGLFELASRPFGGIFFAQQDSQGVPAIENAAGAGAKALELAREYLKS